MINSLHAPMRKTLLLRRALFVYMTINSAIIKIISSQRYLASSHQLFSSSELLQPQSSQKKCSPKKKRSPQPKPKQQPSFHPFQMWLPALLNILFIFSLEKNSCFLNSCPPVCVFQPRAHTNDGLLQDKSASISVWLSGAGSPSSGSWRSYTTTPLMTYQHFTHIFVPSTTIKTFWYMHGTTVEAGDPNPLGKALQSWPPQLLTALQSPFFLYHLI